MSFFKKKISPKEVLKNNEREMATAGRDIEDQIASLELEDAKLVAEIKQNEETGNRDAAIFLRQQLVQLRKRIKDLEGSAAQIRGVYPCMKALYASTSISNGMKLATKGMMAMIKLVAPAKQAKVIKKFQEQSAQMGMMNEMISVAIDETLDEDEAEGGTEELTKQSPTS